MEVIVAAVSVVEVLDTVIVAVAVVVSFSFEILVVFPLGTVADLYAVVAVVSSCSASSEQSANKYPASFDLQF